MSLSTFAVIGKDNSPLYLKEFPKESEVSKTETSQDTTDNQSDPFGFFEVKNEINKTMSLKNKFLIHSALDRFEEIEESTEKQQSGANKMWIGLLGSFDEKKVYGYVTSTRIKFFASMDDVEDGNEQFVREAALKALFANVHEFYIQHMLNPFSDVRNEKKIVSERFDLGIHDLIKSFNENFGKQDNMSWM
ncbi:hypothetical protein CTEN210_03964 [Chaetoceros tenuissimus]|uniref:Trafficking protein particle complex subunit n=1 Tax=Chaetoceros tenuissimus TaxID=426638 RepID=A0AAD3CMN8_9STRA|nr:hypothetical protein CTEN210_03964 [Chaetoceros tenuissimus]